MSENSQDEQAHISSPKIILTRPTDSDLLEEQIEYPIDTTQEDPNEETPLLTNTFPTPVNRTNPVILTIIVSFLILTTLIYYCVRGIDASASNAANIQLDTISISSITPFGLDARIQGNIQVDYNNIPKFFHRNILKLGGLILGNITISHILPVEIFTKVVDVNSPFVHMVDTLPPVLEVDIHPTNTSTSFDFVTPCNFTNSKFWEFLKYFNQVDSDKVNLEVKGIANTNIKARFLSFNVPNIEFHEFVTISKQELIPGIELDQLDVTSSNNGISLKALINIENDYSISLFLNSINWKVMLEDCHSNLIDIGNWKSSPILISPKLPISVSVHGDITSIPKILLADCKSDHTSPIFRLIERYLKNEPVYIYLSACEQQDESDLPDWILSILTSINQRIEIKLPKYDLQPNLLDFINNSTEVLINPTNKENSFFTHLLSNFTLALPSISPIPFSIPSFNSDFQIHQNDTWLVKGSSNSVNHINISDNWHISTSTDSQLTIVDPIKLGKLLDSIFRNQEYNSVVIDVTLHDLIIESSLVNMTVTNLKLPSIPILPGTQTLLFDQQNLLDQLNATVYSVHFIDSSPNSLQLLVDVSTFNPTNITFDLPQEIVSLGIIYNNTKIATATFTDLYIPQNEQTNLTVSCTIDVITNEDKAVLEYFLSEFVSGGYANSTIDIGNNHVIYNSGLSKLIEQINITNLSIPTIKLPIPDEEITSKSCPFIVEATIHILTSEVELTLFNPIVNSELTVEVFQAEAKYKEIILGYLLQQEKLIVPPGIYKTPKLPIKINSIAMDVLKSAINGELDVEVLAMLNVQLGNFDVSLFYKGNNLKSKIGF